MTESVESFDSFTIPNKPKKGKRKSFLPSSTLNTSGELDSSDIFENASNDNNKSTRRRSELRARLDSERRDLFRRQKEGVARVVHGSVNTDETIDATKMQEDYDRVMKLHMGNKITEKNVYSLNINMSKYLLNKYSKKNEKVDFQKAALDIEAGQKIIACKIDALHKETTASVKDLIQKSTAINDEDCDTADDDGDEDPQTGKKGKRKKKLGEVISDISKISEFKLKEKKDPYLYVRASKLDSATGLPDLKCSIADVICATAGIQPNEESKVIDGVEDDFEIPADNFVGWLDFTTADAENPVVTDIKEEWNTVWRELMKTEDIAPTFNKQELSDELTTPVQVEINQKTSTQTNNIEPVTFDFADQNDDDDVPDPFGEPDNFDQVDHDDLPVPPSIVENQPTVAEQFDEFFCPASPAQSHVGDHFSDVGSVQSFASKTSVASNSEGFNRLYGAGAESLLNDIFDSTMKFRKPRIPPRARILSDAEKTKRSESRVKPEKNPRKNIKKTTKLREDETIEFDGESNLLKMLGMSDKKKKPIQKKLFENGDSKKFIRIDTETMEPTNDRFLAGLRKYRFPRAYATEEPEDQETIEDNDIEAQGSIGSPDNQSNIGDMFNEDAHVSSDDENIGGFGDIFNETAEGPSQEEVELPVPNAANVDAHELLRVKQIDKIKMKFDRRARRVNVKHVKKEMKAIIDTHKDQSIVENQENMENGSEDDYVRATTFKDMQEELQSVLEGEDKDNLTPAMALVCVLYLANEENLELEQTTDRDFIIKAPNIPSQKPSV